MSTFWKRIFSIIEKNNDKCILTDWNTQKAYVLMSLDQYEKLLKNVDNSQEEGKEIKKANNFYKKNISENRDIKKIEDKELTEEELLHKINEDIALWKESQKKESKINVEEILINNSNNNVDIEAVPAKEQINVVEDIMNLPVVSQDDEPGNAEDNNEKYYFEPLEENIK